VDLTFTGPNDERTSTVETDADGVGSASLVLTDPAGAAYVTGTYAGKDKIFSSSSDSMFFEVVREVSALSLDLVGKGSKKSLVSHLIDDDGTAIANKNLIVTVGGTRICGNMPTTDASGTTTCEIPSKYQGGHHEFQVVFQQDAFFTRSAASKAT
jgi:hypothetical protein